MLKEFLLIIVLAALASGYGALADDENPAAAESAPNIGFQTKRSRRKLPTSNKLALLFNNFICVFLQYRLLHQVPICNGTHV